MTDTPEDLALLAARMFAGNVRDTTATIIANKWTDRRTFSEPRRVVTRHGGTTRKVTIEGEDDE